jgi:hypothetical protein
LFEPFDIGFEAARGGNQCFPAPVLANNSRFCSGSLTT